MLSPDYRDVLSAFTDERVDYLVVGAYAVASHGLPRATGDLDLWIRSDRENAARVWRALAKFGAPVTEVTASELSIPGLVFQIGVEPTRIDILTSIDGVEFDDAWKDRLQLEIDGLRVQVIGRTHLIANKKAVGRPQDLADVARLESVSKK